MVTRRITGVMLVIVCSFLCRGATGQRTQDAISVGSQTFTLGMPREDVLAKLAGNFRIRKDSDTGWSVWSKHGPYDPIASLTFKRGKLSGVIKYWGPTDQQKGVDFARSLYGALTGFVTEGRRVCTISVDQTQHPGFEAKSASISCGRKYIMVNISVIDKPGAPPEAATVDEFLQLSPQDIGSDH